VDLVIDQGDRLWGVDVKKSASIQRRDARGLTRLAEQAGQSWDTVYCCTRYKHAADSGRAEHVRRVNELAVGKRLGLRTSTKKPSRCRLGFIRRNGRDRVIRTFDPMHPMQWAKGS
jgi:hypothetical protein